jgi:hypothetical protein
MKCFDCNAEIICNKNEMCKDNCDLPYCIDCVCKYLIRFRDLKQEDKYVLDLMNSCFDKVYDIEKYIIAHEL